MYCSACSIIMTSAANAASSCLSRIVLMVRGSEGLARSVDFYHRALRLPVIRATDDWAELAANQNVVLSLQAISNSESQLCTGYTPWLTFTVNDMDATVADCVKLGGHLDGPIQYPAHGKIAVLRSPDNFMLGLYEPAVASTSSTSTSTKTTTRTTPTSGKTTPAAAAGSEKK